MRHTSTETLSKLERPRAHTTASFAARPGARLPLSLAHWRSRAHPVEKRSGPRGPCPDRTRPAKSHAYAWARHRARSTCQRLLIERLSRVASAASLSHGRTGLTRLRTVHSVHCQATLSITCGSKKGKKVLLMLILNLV